jgi:uncharacterized phage protein (TIGR01671 family)
MGKHLKNVKNMTRAIKFKFWSPHGGAFVQNYKYNGLVDELFDHKEWDILTPIEFTGMTDKNKKDLFEGDIIRFFWYFQEKTAQIKFKSGSFCAEIINPSGTLSIVWLHELANKELINKSFEIIGNKFENPELI